MASIMTRIRAAYNAFWNPPGGDGTEQLSFAARRGTRYDVNWRLYWNTAYDDISYYTAMLPTGSKLYKYTRGLRNPVGRWCDFYIANIWGGILDTDAGDGQTAPSVLPIITANEALRPAIAKLWQWSNWNSKRQLATLYSATLGDVFLKVVDRPSAAKVYIQVCWPGDFTACEWDDFGALKACTIEQSTTDSAGRQYSYKEIIEHPDAWGGNYTRFQTFRDGKPWGYDGQPAVWEVPYDFVPVVHIPFVDAGSDWGVTGFVKTRPKIDAANALASQLADQIGKAVNTPLLAFGLAQTSLTVAPNQDGVPIIYIPSPLPESRIEPLITDINLADALAILNSQIDAITDDLPELRLSEAMRSGLSGEALGRAFSDVMAQVQAVRTNHDSGLVRAQQMALTIAGLSGYAPEFAGFGLDSYQAGVLDHHIGARPVLPRTSDEELGELEKRWRLVKDISADGAIPIETALREVLRWGDDKLAAFGQQKAAAILLEQEDVIPEMEQ